MSTVNWQQLLQEAGSGFDLVPNGDYDVVVMSAKDKSSKGGKPAVAANLKVESGPHANSIVYLQFTLTFDNPNAMSFFFQHMAGFGLPRDYFAQLPGDLATALPVVAQALVGRRARISTVIKKWQGEDRVNITQVRPAMSAAGAPPAPPMQQAPPPPPPAPVAPPAPPVAQAPAPAAPAAPAPGYAPPAEPQPQYAPPPPPPAPEQQYAPPAAPVYAPPAEPQYAPPVPEQQYAPPVAPAPEPQPQPQGVPTPPPPPF